MNEFNIVFLALGSNLGDKLKNIQSAIHEIEKQVGTIEQVAKLYETEPWGFENNNWFLNSVIKIKTRFNAHEVLIKCLQIEKKLGRIRNHNTSGYQARIIDIDILFFNNEIIKTPELTIPHPYIQERNFVLFPLADIAPEMIHPVFNKKITELIAEQKDTSIINILKQNLL